MIPQKNTFSEGDSRLSDGSLDNIDTVKRVTELEAENEKLRTKIKRFEKLLQGKDEQIHASEEFGRIVSQNMYTCEYWTTPAGELIFMSPSCERLTGYKPEYFYENERRLLTIIIEEDLVEVVKELRRALQDPRNIPSWEVFFRIRRKDGEIRKVRQINKKIYGFDDVYLGKWSSNIDLTGFSEETGCF
ncbi:hypothetical protein DGMP_23820 [Desulfomarina profundi]|uniref:PAS domain-containing protein n=1 Tax=Desulfomarina profundi TaxID=2772557 RepID=A0A8D5FU17_9BACT|nr:PAS domain-containing protein [Desulfomarina profundi]BCL61689.1 hypothetical protein DGMP_23820 [Desulfomarina profundi]